jgi:hypothetical protein
VVSNPRLPTGNYGKIHFSIISLLRIPIVLCFYVRTSNFTLLRGFLHKFKQLHILDGMRNEFIAARGVHSAIPTFGKVDLYKISCYAVNGQSGEELIAQVKQAQAKGGLLVFLFHGVGGEHGLNVSLPAHSQLLHFLKEREKDIWIAPMVEVAAFIKAQQKKTP